MLQHLVAVHDIELPRSWRDGTKPRLQALSAKLLGLSYGCWRDIIALRCTSELLQPNGKDAIHTSVVEHLLAAGWIAPEQSSLPPQEMLQTPF
jgi:hypothetical protein